MLLEADGVTPAIDISGNMVVPATTDNNGQYRFENLAARDYVVVFEVDAPFAFSAQDAGSDDTIGRVAFHCLLWPSRISHQGAEHSHAQRFLRMIKARA